MTWQPIKTAPRDGQFFIGANVEEAIICNWPKQAKIDYAPGNWKRGRGEEWDGSIIPTKSSLTHWQPLPDLPRIMTNLSPAAQDVLQAFDYARDGEYIGGEWVVNERPMLADALRAAANYCPRDRRILMAIADELEGPR